MRPGGELQIVGDGARGNWITWRWRDGYPFGLSVDRIADWQPLRSELIAALPLTSPRTIDDVRLDGALTRADAEVDLMTRLGRALLPTQLREQIVAVGSQGRLSVRLAPSRSAALVPWGLLVIDDYGGRLLDYADVSWISPLLPRDINGTGIASAGTEALHIVDPNIGWLGNQILDANGAQLWRDHLRAHASVQECLTRTDMAGRLEQAYSRLFLLGHCTGTGGDTGFMLSDGPLRAKDLLRDRPKPWQMPPKVALVACASGLDLNDPEPFGLVTAAMVKGAQLVQATLWPMPTDHAFALGGAGPCMTALAKAVDTAQESDDPAVEICRWQRERLEAWRRCPSLNTSPLAWGSVATVTAPDRSVRQ